MYPNAFHVDYVINIPMAMKINAQILSMLKE